jgi:uncharacterized repeat protein (TIGR01451 family)
MYQNKVINILVLFSLLIGGTFTPTQASYQQLQILSYLEKSQVSVLKVAAAPNAIVTIDVDTDIDSNDAGYRACTGTANDCSLRGAISKANADAGNDYVINLPAGSYTLTLDTVNEDFNASGDLDITGNITINGAGEETTVINGNQVDRIIHVQSGANLELSDLTVINGQAPTEMGSGQGAGGGIYNDDGTITIQNSTIKENQAGDGAGNLSGNAINGGRGGSIFNNGTLTVTNSVITENYSGDGGDCIGTGCFAGDGGHGGGIYNNQGTVTIHDSTIISNTTGTQGTCTGTSCIPADGGWGGGIYNYNGSVDVENSTMRLNIATGGRGGGLHTLNNSSGAVVITNSTISNNIARAGGGFSSYNSHPTLTNVTISSNETTESGGGIYHYGVSGNLSLIHCTITNNTADSDNSDAPDDGGGIYLVDSTMTYSNTIIAGNDDISTPAKDDCGGVAPTSQGYNLVGNGTGCPSNGTGDKTTDDPLLFPLSNSGGSTETHFPILQSLAVNAIPNGTNGCGTTFTSDQRGSDRPDETGGKCDIGSVEKGFPDTTWVDDDWASLPFGTDPDGAGPAISLGYDAFATINDGYDGVGNSTINVYSGTYTETLTVDKNVEIIGLDGAENTIWQAANAPGIATSRVITISTGISATIKGLTIRHGNTTGFGGGIDNRGSLNLKDSVVFNNSGGNGGGIYNMIALTLTNSTIISNTTSDKGGGITNYSSEPWAVAVTHMNNSVVANNHSDKDGGGIFNNVNFATGTATVYLTNCSLNNNSSSLDGGGIYNFANFTDPGTATVTLTNTTLSGNTASNNDGGGMYNERSSASLMEVTFSGNSAEQGGGMYNVNNSNVSLTEVTFSGNSANDGDGGGIYNWSSSLTLNNVTFSGNSTDRKCGGMYNSNSTPSLTNVTFSGNSADYGGGMCNSNSSPTLNNVTFSGNSATVDGGGMVNYESNPTLVNAILWGNTAPNSSQIYNYSSTPVISFSDIQGSGGSAGWDTILGTDGGGNIDADPQFIHNPHDGGDGWGDDPSTPAVDEGANDDYGDLHLQPGSPAIDTGTNSGCPATDLDGTLRPQGFKCDMGAYELGTYSLEIAKSVDDASVEPGQTVTFTVVVTNTGPGITGGQISDILPAGLNFLGPITLEPAGAGTAGSTPPVIAHSLVISANHTVTITFPVTVSHGLIPDSKLTNTALVTSTQVGTPVQSSVSMMMVNLSPNAQDDGGTGFTSDEDTPFTTGNVLVNDSDPDGGILSVTGLNTTGTIGLVTNNGDGTFNYDPNGQFEDLADGEQATDTFTYTISDRQGGSDTATVTITITGVDDGVEIFLPLIIKG